MTFEDFWARYPRRDAKKDARKAWDRLNPDPALQVQIETALDWQLQREQWQDERFIPLPASWIRGERWEDQRSGTDRRQSTSEYEQWRSQGCPHSPKCPHYMACRVVSMREKKTA